ncbi:DHA2 family efflux MFS transporter permease subunit [Williamsia sterculiae]|uniref:Drug resistance transporter, EmrB/QacA subfamily n=1 Tax=Williamsia sterculiae TaxID=1344003 RepID=A0A1N7GIG3_9NOCA|nr:drug resistance transporter, EmrB/QacA subfamily [Williamsia sterculiae]
MHSRPESAATPPPVGAWAALVSCLLAVFMQMLDTTIVNIAIPDLTTGLGAASSQQLLILSVYTLAFACTLLTATTIGSRYGRRRVFVLALLGFAAASTLCGIAQSPWQLIAFRALQGVSAALVSAQTLALIADIFPRSRHGVVFGIYGAVAGVAAMLGPVLGGVLVSLDVFGWGWRTIFLVNIPVSVVAAVMALRYMPRQRGSRDLAVDGVGVVASTVGLFMLIYPLAVGREQDWPAHLWVMIAVAVVVLAAFVVHEHRLPRRGGAPLLRVDLFSSRQFAVGAVLSLLFFSMFAAFFFTMSVATQFGLGWSALRTGLITMPFAAGAIVGSLASASAVRHLGPRTLTVGMVLLAVGLAWVAAELAPESARVDVPSLIAPLVLGGLGTGLFVAPLQATILSGSDEHTVGSASGLIPTVQQLGASLGLAVITIFFFSQVSHTAVTAVPGATAGLSRALQDTDVAPTLRPFVASNFARCARAQLESAHPERPASGCSTTAPSGGARAQVLAAATPDLRAAARQAAAWTFVGALRTSLYLSAGLATLVAACSLLLRRSTGGR